MKIGFFIAHPSQYYIFKELGKRLSQNHEIFSFYVPKDVLEDLMAHDSFNSNAVKIKLPKNIKFKIVNMIYSFLYKEVQFLLQARNMKLDLLVGTSIITAHIGSILRIPNIILTEDDLNVISISAKIGYPFCTKILSPIVCNLGRYENKKIKYDGYQKIVYLHPRIFKYDPGVIKKYDLKEKEYVILRFSALQAHHDIGKEGISDRIAEDIISYVDSDYKVLISSEKVLKGDLDKYRFKIEAHEIHHILSKAKLLVSDSQSMSVESALLGVPSIRISDFVNKISVLEEIEKEYCITYGVLPNIAFEDTEVIKNLIEIVINKDVYQAKSEKIFSDKINVADFFYWFIDNYPDSLHTCESNPDYANNFKENLLN